MNEKKLTVQKIKVPILVQLPDGRSRVETIEVDAEVTDLTSETPLKSGETFIITTTYPITEDDGNEKSA